MRITLLYYYIRSFFCWLALSIFLPWQIKNGALSYFSSSYPEIRLCCCCCCCSKRKSLTLRMSHSPKKKNSLTEKHRFVFYFCPTLWGNWVFLSSRLTAPNIWAISSSSIPPPLPIEALAPPLPLLLFLRVNKRECSLSSPLSPSSTPSSSVSWDKALLLLFLLLQSVFVLLLLLPSTSWLLSLRSFIREKKGKESRR